MSNAWFECVGADSFVVLCSGLITATCVVLNLLWCRIQCVCVFVQTADRKHSYHWVTGRGTCILWINTEWFRQAESLRQSLRWIKKCFSLFLSCLSFLCPPCLFFPSFHSQDQFDNLDKHTQWGIDFVERYAKFVKERLDIEQTYAKQLRYTHTHAQDKNKYTWAW